MAAKQGGNSTLRAVFFDLDDTLRVSQPHPNDAFTAFVEEQGVALSETDRKESFRWGHSYWANSTTLLDDYEKHQGYEDPFWQNYTRRHLRSLNLDEDTIERLAPDVHSYMGQAYRPQSVLVPNTFTILDQLRAALEELNRLQRKPVMIEYLMLDGVNDAPKDARALADWLEGLSVHVNLIPYNPIDDAPHLQSTPQERRDAFASSLKQVGLQTTIRYSLGADIAAACGQLVRRENRQLRATLQAESY